MTMPALQPMTDNDRATAEQLEARELAADFAANEARGQFLAGEPPAGLRWVKVSTIQTAKQTRTENGLDLESLSELAASIQARGLLSPPLLQLDEAGQLTVIAGHRRVAACAMAGLEYIPAMVGTMTTRHDQIMAQLAENVHRLDLTTADTARAVRTLFDSTGGDAEQTAKMMGKSRAWTCKHLAVTTPEFSWTARNLLETGRVTDLELLHGLNQLDKLHSPKLSDAIKRAQAGNLKRDDLRKWVQEAKEAKREEERKKREAKKARATGEATRTPPPPAPLTWRDLVARAELRGDDLAACTSVVDELEDHERRTLLAELDETHAAGAQCAKMTREQTLLHYIAWTERRYMPPWRGAAWTMGATGQRLDLSTALHMVRTITTTAADQNNS